MLQTINRVSIVIIWTLFVIMILILVWGMNKGFDFSDEGFSMLSLTKDQEQGMEIMPVYRILQKSFSVFNPGVVFYRLLRIILLLTGTAIFVTGLIAYLRKMVPEVTWPAFFITYPVAVLCGLINYSIFYQSISYNSLTFIMMLIAAGNLLQSQSFSDSTSLKGKRLFLLVAGLSCGILFLIKLSSGILFSAASLAMLFTRLPEKEKLKSLLETIIIFFSGFTLSLLLLYVAGYSPMEFAANIRIATSILPGHQSFQLLEVYRDDLQKNFLKVVSYHKAFLFIPVLLWLLYRFAFTRLFITVSAFCSILLIKKFIDHDWYKSGMEGMSSASIIYILLMWAFLVFLFFESMAFLIKQKNRSSPPGLMRLCPLFLLLLFSPFAASAGTNNPFSIHITQFLFFWMILFLLIIEIVAGKNIRYQIFRPLFALILLIIVCSQFLFGFILSPYRLNHGLNQQTLKLTVRSNAGSVSVDKSAYGFTNAIMGILKHHGYHNGNFHALSLFSYPGLVYLTGASSPGAAWYFGDGYQGNEKANCFMISKTKITDLRRTVIFLDSNKPVSTEFSECLKNKGILFPENYFCADSVILPDSSGYLKIYFPN